MLTEKEKQSIISDFPNIKLSYEKIIHKKVYNCDLIFAIPEGKKCFIWFNLYNNKPLCFMLEFDDKNKNFIQNIKIVNCCFTSSLCYGTIFYGTMFYHLNNPFFCIEDIFMYKGQDISRFNLVDKVNKICDILKKEIKQLSYNNYCMVFGLPLISTSSDTLENDLKKIKYKLSYIKYLNKNNLNFILKFDEYTNNVKEYDTKNIKQDYTKNIKQDDTKNIKQEFNILNKNDKDKEKRFTKIFIVKPDIQNDIYHLYTLDNVYDSIACIPDYKTSVMMNKLFRIIKENNDLDALEESDDEEEFENPNIDKFVNLEKSYKMICNLNKKFKKWVPIKIND
jgi:hypothetical protein